MTTAHRPTFDPARGKEAPKGPAYHQRLLPAHTQLKYRKPGQGGDGNYGVRDLRVELLAAEKVHQAKLHGGAGPSGDDDATVTTIRSTHTFPAHKRRMIGDSSDGSGGGGDGGDGNDDGEDPEAKRRRILAETRDIDADSDSGSGSDSGSDGGRKTKAKGGGVAGNDDGDSESESGSSDDSNDDDSDEDSDDETAELQRELEKIKRERAEKRAREQEEQLAAEEEAREHDIARGNPLLNKPDFTIKRRWDDDVVFKNQARGTDDRGKKNEFINDLLRSDFHKRFMSKYVR